MLLLINGAPKAPKKNFLRKPVGETPGGPSGGPPKNPAESGGLSEAIAPGKLM